jgi:glycine/D-amino acid oxidase-like deaminating enzyme
MFVARGPMQPGGFEHDSYQTLTRRGHRLERLDAAAIAHRFPAYRDGVHVDGYFNPVGGWAHASAVVAQLAAEAAAAGVAIRVGTVDALVDGGAMVDGAREAADLIVVCSGAWAPVLVPELAGAVRAIGQPVFHLRPDDGDRALFEAVRFPVFGADIARTGYYGFPIDDSGVVKIANHGIGRSIGTDLDRAVSAEQESTLRGLVREVFPALADAAIVERRLCVYGDTMDGNFWIAPHPDRPGVVVATGGSGHAFKFAPVLGDLIAAIAVGESHPLEKKFCWRGIATTDREAARHRD